MGCLKSEYVSIDRAFHESIVRRKAFEQRNWGWRLQSGRVRVSPSSLGSKSWVGRDQGHTGGVGGEGAENWCMGDARKGMRQDMGG